MANSGTEETRTKSLTGDEARRQGLQILARLIARSITGASICQPPEASSSNDKKAGLPGCSSNATQGEKGLPCSPHKLP